MLNSSTAISTFKVKTFQDNKESTYPFIEQRNDYGARKRKLSRRNQKRTPKVISKNALIKHTLICKIYVWIPFAPPSSNF